MAERRPSYAKAVAKLPEGVVAAYHARFGRPVVVTENLSQTQVAALEGLGWTYVETYARYFGPRCESP